MKRSSILVWIALCAAASGCGPNFGPKARQGITFYCPGAGNVDFGDAGVRAGLEAAGYQGEVASIVWTVSFNPAIDQVVRVNALLGAARLADYIAQYKEKYPDGAVNLIGLSAGSGVAIWALEKLDAPYEVNNVVLLGSSLNHAYDVSKALRRVRGRIYNYYSPNDAVLAGPMKVFGTIDGIPLVDGAGAVGLHPPRPTDRVVNVAWKPEFQRYGYYGGHTDSTTPAFVRAKIAPHIIASESPTARDTAPARHLATAPPGEPRD